MWHFHPGNGLDPSHGKRPGAVHVLDDEFISNAVPAPCFHAHGMDLICAGSASDDVLIDPVCMFVDRLAVGSTAPERLAGTINVRRAMIDAEQAFQERLGSKQERLSSSALDPPMEIWQGGRGDQATAASKICPAIRATRTGLEQRNNLVWSFDRVFTQCN